MRNSICNVLGVLISPCLAFASANSQTSVIFARDGTKATVLMMATTSNPDAQALYEVLDLPVVEQSGKLTKTYKFIDDSGNNSVNFACAFSKIATGTGSCFVVFHNTRGVTFDPAHKTISFFTNGAEAARLANIFHRPNGTEEFFRTSDHLLSFKQKLDPGGEAVKLDLTYGL